MRNKEKAKEFARKHQGSMTDSQYLQMLYALEEMAQWKDEQYFQDSLKSDMTIFKKIQGHFIEKACEWLYSRQAVDLEVPNIDKFVEDFRKAMEDEK